MDRIKLTKKNYYDATVENFKNSSKVKIFKIKQRKKNV